jgi:hypothetical protein
MGFAMTVRFLSPASGGDYKEEWQSAKKTATLHVKARIQDKSHDS